MADGGTRRSRSDKPMLELRELLKAKEDSLNLTIHELLGPLGRIAGYLSMMSDGDLGALPESARQAVENATVDARLMARMLDRLADVARLESAAHLRGRRCLCKIGDMLTAATSRVRVEASAKHIRLERHLAESDLEVAGDPDQLSAAVANLLSNAIKYSPESSTVTVRAAIRNGGIAIVVTDQGAGSGRRTLLGCSKSTIEPAAPPLVSGSASTSFEASLNRTAAS